MRLWVLSDLHIDDFEDWCEQIDLGPHPDHDVIVMAGDLCDGDRNPIPWLISEFSDAERERMLFVPGNHEAWGIGTANVRDRLRGLREQCGIKTLNRETLEIDGRRFVGATMWTPLSENLDHLDGDLAAIPDFDGAKWRGRHARDRAWLEETVQLGDIVITHHAPHYEGLATAMQHNVRLWRLQSGYFADMESLIAERRPALWIHGHTHATRQYDVDGVPIVTNARGRGYAPNFKPNFVFELPEPTPVPKWP